MIRSQDNSEGEDLVPKNPGKIRLTRIYSKTFYSDHNVDCPSDSRGLV